MEASDKRIFAALKSRSKSLNLDNNGLQKIPDSLGRLISLTSFSVKNNHLKSLNSNLSKLTAQLQLMPPDKSVSLKMTPCYGLPWLGPLQPAGVVDRPLRYLNAGSNVLEDGSLDCLQTCDQLIKLHLFKNSLSEFNPQLCKSLVHLRVLNLNWNKLQIVPAEIGQLECLEQLSLSHNQLEWVPRQLGFLQHLTELHLDNNDLTSLPPSLHTCPRLHTLLVHKNQLTKLPECVGKSRSLAVLDVSCNFLEMLPHSFSGNVKLREFYFEENPFLPHIPIPSEQQLEVLPLRELAARALVKRLEPDEGWLDRLMELDSTVGRMCSQVGRCCLCGGPYLQSQLDCVQFVPVKKVLPSVHATTSGTKLLLPIYSPLCSHQCFNSQDNNFYGIAMPHPPD